MLFKNTASQKVRVFAFDSTTGQPKTGDAANISAYISKDYGSVTQLTDTSATEEDSTNAKGYYLFDITQTETNADNINVTGKSSTSNIVVVGAPAGIATRPPNAGALSIDSSGRVDVIKVNGTTQTARDLGASVLLSNGTGTGQVSLSSGTVTVGTNNDKTGYSVSALANNTITAASIASNAITSAKIATDAIGAAQLAADAVAEIAAGLGTVNADIVSITGGDGSYADSLLQVLANDGSGFTSNVATVVWAYGIRTLTSAANITSTGGTTVPQTGDAFARLGAPAGASVSADIATINAKTDNLPASFPTNFGSLSIDANGRVKIQSGVPKNTALAGFQFFMCDSADHVTGKTGLTITATRSLDGAAFGACANSATEIANGMYKIDLAAADLNGNTVTLRFTGTGADDRFIEIVTTP